MQAHQSCVLQQPFDTQTEAKPCPTANTEFMPVQKGLSRSAGPQPQIPFCTPIHTPTIVSSATNILLVGKKARKTLWVAEQEHYPSHTAPALHLAEDWHGETQPRPHSRGQEEDLIALAHSGVLHLDLVGAETFLLALWSVIQRVEKPPSWFQKLTRPLNFASYYIIPWQDCTNRHTDLHVPCYDYHPKLFQPITNKPHNSELAPNPLSRQMWPLSCLCISNGSPNSWLPQSHHVNSHPAQKELWFEITQSEKPCW